MTTILEKIRGYLGMKTVTTTSFPRTKNSIYNSRDEIWNAVFRLYYDTYYIEKLEDTLLLIWQRLDRLTKIVVAVSAGGATLVGTGGFVTNRAWWVFLAGTAALLSLIHSALAVGKLIEDHLESKRRFTQLRINLTSLRDEMRFEPEFDTNEVIKKLEEYRKIFIDSNSLLQNDILRTLRLSRRVQEELNRTIGDEIL